LANDRAIGGAILAASIVGVIVYGGLLYLPWAWEWTIRITAFLGVGILLAILGWIGYTMASTPPPEPIVDIPNMTPPKTEADAPNPQTEK